MPRPEGKSAALERHIEAIVARAARGIASAVRRNIATEVARLVAAAESGDARQRRVIVCPVAGCGAPGGGPKWGWFCATHKDLPAAEKQRARAARDRRSRR